MPSFDLQFRSGPTGIPQRMPKDDSDEFQNAETDMIPQKNTNNRHIGMGQYLRSFKGPQMFRPNLVVLNIILYIYIYIYILMCMCMYICIHMSYNITISYINVDSCPDKASTAKRLQTNRTLGISRNFHSWSLLLKSISHGVLENPPFSSGISSYPPSIQ